MCMYIYSTRMYAGIDPACFLQNMSQLQADPVNEPLCFSEKAQVGRLEVPVRRCWKTLPSGND